MTPHDGKKVQALIPTNHTAARVLPYLVRALDLPTEHAGGGPVTYYLTADTRGEGAIQLEAEDVLHEEGVTDGTVLRIVPAMTAGTHRVAQ